MNERKFKSIVTLYYEYGECVISDTKPTADYVTEYKVDYTFAKKGTIFTMEKIDPEEACGNTIELSSSPLGVWFINEQEIQDSGWFVEVIKK